MGNQKKRRKSGKVKDPYAPEVVRRKRTLPKGDIIGLCILICLQLVGVLGIIFYRPTPDDVIRDYTITVEPRADGTLEIHYDFVWTALAWTEDLTWVEIGMPHPDYVLVQGSVSDTVERETNIFGMRITALTDSFSRTRISTEKPWSFPLLFRLKVF